MSKEIQQRPYDNRKEFNINSNGFVELKKEIEPRIKRMSDREICAWAGKRDKSEADFTIATFFMGDRGDWISVDLNKLGVLKNTPEDFQVEAGKAYVVSIIQDTNDSNKTKGAYFVEVLRDPNLQDLKAVTRKDSWQRLLRSDSKMKADRWLDSVTLTSNSFGYLGKERVGYEKVLLDKHASVEASEGERWAGLVIQRKGLKTFYPIKQAEDWEEKIVIWGENDTGSAKSPQVLYKKVNGIETIESKKTTIDSLQALNQYLANLPKEERVVLARLWNIYWKKQNSRRELLGSVIDKLKAQT